jgi:hypothetical protein
VKVKAFARIARTAVVCLAVVYLGALAARSVEARQQARDQPNGGRQKDPAPLQRPAAVIAQGAFATTGQVPFTVDSPWNTPIAADAVADPDSDAMVSLIAANGRLRSDPAQYTFPVYFADPTTPRVTMSCTDGAYTINLDGTRTSSGTKQVADVPIPAGATPSPGRDAQMVVIDRITGDEYDIWIAYPDTCRIMTKYVQGVYRGAAEATYPSRGAGVPYLSGLIRPWEIAQGHIDHALALGHPTLDHARCVWPASKSEGTIDWAGIPAGALIQLDPTLDVDTIPGLSVTGRIIARALQVYGAYLVDTSGSNKLYTESSITAAWGGAANPSPGRDRVASPEPPRNQTGGLNWAYPDPPTVRLSGVMLTATTVSAIPVSRLRVLQLPTAYRSLPYSPTFGQCVQ